MKKIAFITLLAAAGLVPVAHAHDGEQPNADREVVTGVGVPPAECPEGTYPTPIGDCQPDFEP